MLKLFLKAGWEVRWQKGSHVRVMKDSLNETIPMHKELRRGMEQKLLKILGTRGAK